jgi:hypothetical protein
VRKPRVIHVAEPRLGFRFSQACEYPRDGLYLFGPVDAKAQPRTIHYGVIGTPEGLRRFGVWAKQASGFIDIPPKGPRSKAIEPHHVPFPGISEAFHSEWPINAPRSIIDIDERELSDALHIRNRHEAIKTTVDMFVSRLVADKNRQEDPPSFWYVVIPEVVYQLGRPLSSVPAKERIEGKVQLTEKAAIELLTQPTLFGLDEGEAEVYRYERHFRRQLKARLLKDQIVTQIVRETTLTPEEFLDASGRAPKRRLEDRATLTWKLATCSYYKSGGRPWQLADMRAGVCYVGIVYKQLPEGGDARYACCAAQMFLTDSEGVVFRGALGPWYQPDEKQFHLDKTAAMDLIEKVLSEYRVNHDDDPAELFIHAKSSFSDEEWEGFEAACIGKRTRVVGVQILDGREHLKLFRPGNYPVIRGTALVTSDRSAYLWTSGYVPRLDTYMGPDTPNPLLVSIRRGEADIATVLADVLALTKLNFNSCLFNDRKPVTIRFADAIGDILVAAPLGTESRLPFKFYI